MEAQNLDWVSALERGHLCWLYWSEAEHRAVMRDFLAQGLQRGERLLYLFDTHDEAELRERPHDLDRPLQAYLDSGQLRLARAKATYTPDGTFDPARMIESLRQEIRAARREGYTLLRVTGEMTWGEGPVPGSDRLIEYEARLNDLVDEEPCSTTP